MLFVYLVSLTLSRRIHKHNLTLHPFSHLELCCNSALADVGLLL